MRNLADLTAQVGTSAAKTLLASLKTLYYASWKPLGLVFAVFREKTIKPKKTIEKLFFGINE